MASRIDTLQSPPGARRAPVIVFLMVAAVAAVMVLLGMSQWGWLAAMLVPVLALTLYIVLNTIRVLVWEARARKEEGKE